MQTHKRQDIQTYKKAFRERKGKVATVFGFNTQNSTKCKSFLNEKEMNTILGFVLSNKAACQTE